ncbi:MAG: hypothetical protein IT348_19055 [Candidatus Eisenbacteria bacterium]|nr:hypothetical protein [Candidatus Eisenbacteria bacterium]
MKPQALLLATALLVSPSLSRSAAIRPWVSGALAGSTYAMGDVNDDISTINSALNGSGLKMEKMSSGVGFGFSAGLDMGSGWSIGLGYDRLNASSDVGDYSGSLEYDMPGSLLRGFGRYTFASPGKVKGFLEGSAGRVTAGGSVTLSATGGGALSRDVEGSGIAFEASAGGEIWAAPQLAFTGSAGFRKAEAKNVTSDGTPVFTASGEDYTIDYSGLFARLGVKIAFVP